MNEGTGIRAYNLIHTSLLCSQNRLCGEVSAGQLAKAGRRPAFGCPGHRDPLAVPPTAEHQPRRGFRGGADRRNAAARPCIGPVDRGLRWGAVSGACPPPCCRSISHASDPSARRHGDGAVSPLGRARHMPAPRPTGIWACHPRWRALNPRVLVGAVGGGAGLFAHFPPTLTQASCRGRRVRREARSGFGGGSARHNTAWWC